MPCCTGGGAFGLFGKKTNKFGRDPIVVLGYVLHMAAFYIAFANLPMDSPIRETDAPTYFSPGCVKTVCVSCVLCVCVCVCVVCVCLCVCVCVCLLYVSVCVCVFSI